ncbi:HAD family hydrolase [Phycicoccus sp. BSK3Z-2]|uniref:HAD family hydrolase n=1 Tax=Phycicoccus avicenniae TaxID=2828860 RepID=A0A941D9D7_9MICO|nr:HAD family hydrolase [Phycicoccus avicenniae]MBR7744524.1 HAD family hydrolase [Phycicoccus avicenniae]
MSAVPGPEVQAVLLDADDTVYDTRSAMHAAGAAAAAALWPDADPDRLADAGVRFRSDPEGHFTAYTRGEIEFDEMRRARVTELAHWLDQPVDRDWWDAFEEHYEHRFLGGLRAFDDVRPTVTALRGQGVAVGVLTNSSAEYTGRKMRACGLGDLFDVVCTRDTLGYGKPDERAYVEACHRLGADPARTLYVGDELSNDPLGASDAGLRAAWLVRDGAPDERGLRLVRARGIPVVTGLEGVVDLVAGPSGLAS